ncbi:serine protease inhibitor Kazal-type 9-like [Dasypus novemcinctus]|uniref:serine protease inhibitor Kazal-type 9-like n=1 Tax=Dasypus novemcinctus TaxID=9361 RepID=UPI0003292515|nr:serine protease inhibitor Kazal-type 9-like [Dasypus novemcinctus]
MRATAFVLLLALALATIFNAECVQQRRPVNCSNYKKPPPGKAEVCMAVYRPICGSDSKTYSNECFFCIAVRKSNGRLKFAHFGRCLEIMAASL